MICIMACRKHESMRREGDLVLDYVHLDASSMGTCACLDYPIKTKHHDMKKTLPYLRAPLVSLLSLATLCSVVVFGAACKTSDGGKTDGDVIKETPSNTREFTKEELSRFLTTSNFDMYGGVVSSQYIDLNGVAPRELLVEVRCAQQSCYGDFYKIQGSNYFLYSLSESLDNPQMLTPKPISMGPDGQAQMADIDGDKQADLLISGQGRDGSRHLKIYSVLGKLLSSRFEGSLPYGAISQLIMDLDEDGSMEIVTLQQQDTSTQAMNGYGGGYGYGPGIQADLLDSLTVQTWQVSRGSLNLKSVKSQSGLAKAFEAMRANPDTPIMDLARAMILMRHYKQTVKDPGPLLVRIMETYDALRKNGQKFSITTQQQDPYNYPQYDPYGNPITPDEFANTPSYDMYVLLGAMKLPNQPAVASWSEAYVGEANTLDELSAQLELSLGAAPDDRREELSIKYLDHAFNVLLDEGPNSPNFYNLAYFDPSIQQMEPVQRQFFIASFLLDPSFAFKGREQVIKRFLDRSVKNPMAMQTLLPQYPLAQAISPYLMEMDLAKMPSDFVSVMLNQILPTYISTAQAQGGLKEESKKKLAANLKSFMTRYPDRRNEVLYFVSNYFQDQAFAPIIASMMSDLRTKFEGGRATQADRDNLYNVSMLLPIAMTELNTSDRKWWINYVYRQGMGYNLDAKLSEGCYDLKSQSDAQIETILSSMETLPKESTLASMCLPYMLGVYDLGTSPLKDKYKARLPDIIDARLQPGGDEYQLQQFLMTLENYDKLSEFAPSLWRVAKKRKGPMDTARYQALVMLAKMGEKDAMKQLRKTSKKLFTDTKFRDKNPYFNDYFYVDLLARQQSTELLELMFELAEDKKILPNSCVLLRDYMQSYGRTADFSAEQQTRWEKLCGGSTASTGVSGGLGISGMGTEGGAIEF